MLTLASGGTRPTGVKTDVYNENSTLPDKDVVITYVMTLNHIKPDQAVNIFTQVVGQFGAYGSIAAVPNASAVVITEKASLIGSLIDLKKSIDVPGSVQSTRFIKVQYADVTEIADTLTELLTAQQSTQKTAGIQRTDSGNPSCPRRRGRPGRCILRRRWRRGNPCPNHPGTPHQPHLRHGPPRRSALRRRPRPRVRRAHQRQNLPPPQTSLPHRIRVPAHRW